MEKCIAMKKNDCSVLVEKNCPGAEKCVFYKSTKHLRKIRPLPMPGCPNCRWCSSDTLLTPITTKNSLGARIPIDGGGFLCTKITKVMPTTQLGRHLPISGAKNARQKETRGCASLIPTVN